MKKILFCAASVVLIFSCKSGEEKKFTKENLTDSINVKEEALKKIEALMPSNAVAFETIKLYKQFADSFPNEKNAPGYLFKAANISIGVGQYPMAISFLERIQNHFPEYEKSCESLFLMGFIYDNHLHQKGKAEEIYLQVIEKYPEHKFALEAKEVIKTLSMSDEELIKMFKEKEEAMAEKSAK